MRIETKYSVGDVVYTPVLDRKDAWEPCPDCLGQRKWLAVLPCGEEEFMACPTCARGYGGSKGMVQSHEYEGHVERLTIGSVRVETGRDGETRYMCEETGVGSGRIYDEDDLYQTFEEAAALLPGLVAQRQLDFEETRARSWARNRKERAGRMVSHWRRQIRRAKKDIEAAERGLAREVAEGRT